MNVVTFTYEQRVEQRNKLRAMLDFLHRSGSGQAKLYEVNTSDSILEAIIRLENFPGTLKKALDWLKVHCRDELGRRLPNGRTIGQRYNVH